VRSLLSLIESLIWLPGSTFGKAWRRTKVSITKLLHGTHSDKAEELGSYKENYTVEDGADKHACTTDGMSMQSDGV
jgi:hypothetical protein